MKFDKNKQQVSQVCLNVLYVDADNNIQLKTCKQVDECIKEKYYEIYYCPFKVRKLV